MAIAVEFLVSAPTHEDNSRMALPGGTKHQHRMLLGIIQNEFSSLAARYQMNDLSAQENRIYNGVRNFTRIIESEVVYGEDGKGAAQLSQPLDIEVAQYICAAIALNSEQKRQMLHGPEEDRSNLFFLDEVFQVLTPPANVNHMNGRRVVSAS